MTLNGVMAVILRYFTEFGSFRGAPCKVVEEKKVTLAISSPDEYFVSFHLRSDFVWTVSKYIWSYLR